MRQSNQAADRHSPAVILMHWGTMLAIVISVAAIYLRQATEDKWLRQTLLDVHRQLGLIVLLGSALRLVVRYTVGLVDFGGPMHVILRGGKLLSHLGLYLLLIAVPILGWAASNAHAINLNLFGVIPLPNLVSTNTDLADTLDDYHKWASWAFGVLVLEHTLAALWHHYVRKNSVLVAMLPTGRAR